MTRSVLKPHAHLFLGVLRITDPAISVAIGLIAYRLYLGEPWPPEHYLLFLGATAVTIVALFPLIGLYEP
jgi:hypothetical protein